MTPIGSLSEKPDIPKPTNRPGLILDADYFLRESTHRLKALARLDARNELAYRQAAALTYRARVGLRGVVEGDRRRRMAA